MCEIDLIEQAENFLKNKNICFAKPGTIGRRYDDRIEVIFSVPEALNPNVVIDPPDIRLWVNVNSGEVNLVPQM